MGYDGICSVCGYKGDVSPIPSRGRSYCPPCLKKYVMEGSD